MVSGAPRGSGMEIMYHGLDFGLVCALLQSILKLILRGDIRSIVLVDLFRVAVSSGALNSARWFIPCYMNSQGTTPSCPSNSDSLCAEYKVSSGWNAFSLQQSAVSRQFPWCPESVGCYVYLRRLEGEIGPRWKGAGEGEVGGR